VILAYDGRIEREYSIPILKFIATAKESEGSGLGGPKRDDSKRDKDKKDKDDPKIPMSFPARGTPSLVQFAWQENPLTKRLDKRRLIREHLEKMRRRVRAGYGQ